MMEKVRNPLSLVNEHILRIWGYFDRYNPNQTTFVSTLVTVAGTSLYVYGILSWNHSAAVAGMGAFVAWRYGDLLDGDHARMLRKKGKWNTQSWAIFDADMDKATIYVTLAWLIGTHTLPETHTYILMVEFLAMGILDGVSYGNRSGERSWKKVWQSIIQNDWDESSILNWEQWNPKKNLQANTYGKIKTLFQTLGITALWVGAILDDPISAQNLQKLWHPFFLGAIGFAWKSLWDKMKAK
jgi:phosphatidylglycerophosphate synthase